MRRLSLAVAVSLLLAASGAQAVTSAQLRDQCRAAEAGRADQAAPDAKINRALCTGYLLGFVDGIEEAATLSQTDRLICIPASATEQQLANAYVRWVAEHPREQDRPAMATTYMAMTSAYPCKK